MIAGRYTLEREIGRGGAGSVHLAHDELLDRSVAIKRIGLLPGTTGQDIARAEREARLAAGINHPHVVSIFDLVKDEDCYWLVMELVRGRTLTQVVGEEGPLPPARAAGLVAQAADALVQADRAGIVHRDVKPGNIMVGDDDHAKLGDFGIARSGTDAALTQTGFITGSPAYLAPEVASGSPATAASDVWSLGGTLYFALTGRPPYDVGDNVMGGLYRIVHDEPPRLPDDHPLAALLAVMLVKDPAARWPVGRVRDELRRAARGEPVAPPAGTRPQDPDATVAMAAAPPPPRDLDEGAGQGDGQGDRQAQATTPVPVAPVTPAPTPVEQAEPPRRRTPGWLAAALALVVVAGLAAWLLWPGDDADPTGDAGSTSSSQPSTSAEPSPSEEPSPTEDPTEDPAEEPDTEPPAAGGSPGQMKKFVEDYFATVTSDPQAAFAMLTPEFQAASGGYEGYSGFWSTIESARPSKIKVDKDAMTASYTVDYVTTSGDTRTEQVTLQLTQQGEEYLIAGEG